ncbi:MULTISPECIES: glycosyltransferase [Enterobacteriaceae]|uniref:Glycosyltransferase n=1 Tax=Cronobacter sakazakii TaxID=28141 RepID=A0A853HBH9_CROSK|nr:MULTISPECIES: glycosyltransferase [Enterobacteriaceae]HCB1684030.1 glycosyltransferase [Citrobacter braakii]EIH9539828.1 glycosyltransferase [Escherichia coli]NYV41063.1 glycosyltransferase [Cronobacter sakazakii]VFS74448.1 glycosyl transferase, group 2 [Escherichia coli]HAI2337229.1 glycosyltransferase [Escherichia coli]
MDNSISKVIIVPDVAVIISVYYKDKVLPLYMSLLSIFNQSYKKIVVLLKVDGVVEPDVKRLICIFERKYSNFFVFWREENLGLARSMNELLDYIMTGLTNIKYIARMDADDVAHLDRIKKQIDFLELHNDVSVLGTACKEFGIYNKIIKKLETDEEIKQDIIRVTPFIHPSVIFRVNVFFDGFRYPTQTVLSEDLGFWLVLCLNGYKFANLNDILLDYRLTSSTLKRRIGLRKASSELKERFEFVLISKQRVCINVCFIIGHFFIRLMPISVVKVLYKILR